MAARLSMFGVIVALALQLVIAYGLLGIWGTGLIAFNYQTMLALEAYFRASARTEEQEGRA